MTKICHDLQNIRVNVAEHLPKKFVVELGLSAALLCRFLEHSQMFLSYDCQKDVTIAGS